MTVSAHGESGHFRSQVYERAFRISVLRFLAFGFPCETISLWLRCGYLVGSSDFNMLGNSGFPLDPQDNLLFGRGSRATTSWLPCLSLSSCRYLPADAVGSSEFVSVSGAPQVTEQIYDCSSTGMHQLCMTYVYI